MKATPFPDKPAVTLDEWRVIAHVAADLSPVAADRVRRQVERALTRAARRLSRRCRLPATVRVQR